MKPSNDYKNSVVKHYLDMINKNQVPKIISKFHKINKNLEDCLRNRYIWCSSPDKFNDPFDTIYNNKSHIRKEQIKGWEDDYVKETFASLFNDYAKSQRISCFSDVENVKAKEILLWSHYADEHRGICILFDLKKLLNYWNDNYTFLTFHKVIYSSTFPEVNIKYLGNGKLNASLEFLQTKSINWEYEQEYRVFHSQNKLSFPKEAIKEIIFGCMTPDNDIKKVIEICKYVKKFKKAKKSITSFKLEYEKINPRNYK